MQEHIVKITEIAKLELKEGDILVVNVADMTTPSQCELLIDALKKVIPKGSHIIPVTTDINNFKVISPDNAH